MQQKDSLHSTKSCSASTASTTAIKQRTTNATLDVENVVTNTIPANARTSEPQTAFNAKTRMKHGTPSALRALLRKSD